MAEAKGDSTPSLAEQYLLKDKEEKPDLDTKPADVKEPENIVNAASEEPVTTAAEVISAEVTPAAEETSDTTTDVAVVEKAEEVSAGAEDSSEPAAAAEASEEGNSGDQEAAEEAPEIKLETAPADFRFPTTNQTRHCFTRYIEYHRCVAAKGEGAPECDKFAKYYRSLCPGEWVEKWNEQRENGTFPGPL